MLNKKIKQLLESCGIHVRKLTQHETFLSSERIKMLVRPNTMLSNKALLNILESIDYVNKNNLSGAFVECGVWKGGATVLAAMYANTISDFSMDLRLFDSFGEICEPDASEDGKRAVIEAGGVENARGRLIPSGMYERMGREAGQVDLVRDLIEKKSRLPKGEGHSAQRLVSRHHAEM